jgi:hypothetical protein
LASTNLKALYLVELLASSHHAKQVHAFPSQLFIVYQKKVSKNGKKKLPAISAKPSPFVLPYEAILMEH